MFLSPGLHSFLTKKIADKKNSSAPKTKMPKHKQVKRLESLAMRSLTEFVRQLGDELVPLFAKAFEMTLPDLHAEMIDINDFDDDSLPEDFIFMDELEQMREISRRRRKSSTRSIESCHRSGYTQKQITAILRARIDFLHDYFMYNIPWHLFDRLCQHLFFEIPNMVDAIKARRTMKTSQSEFMSQVNVAVALVEVVVGQFLTHCDFGEMPKVVQQVFYLRLKDLKGMEHLNLGSLTGGWKIDEMEPTILAGITNMPNLHYLNLNYDCTNTILLRLIESCPRLHTLDLTSAKAINNESVNLLIRMPTLRVVQLHRTSVTLEGYVKLLLGLKNLEDIGRYDDIGPCLEYIVDFYPQVKTLALRKFASRYVTTRFLQICAEYCPNMANVSIFFNPLICDLTALIGINKLTVLSLLSCDFFSDQIRDVLQVKGCNLSHLHLEHVDQIDMNALMYISQYCPDLQILTIYNCELIESTSMYMDRPTIPPFMNLERLTVVAQCDHRHLEFLFSTCLRIKQIKCGTQTPTTDHLFERILARNPMEHLQELSITQSHGLTIAMAYKLAEICPNLTSLDELEGWKLIKDDELQAFRAFVKTNNLDLNTESKRFRTPAEELL